MFKQRFLTAVCLIPLVFMLIYYGNPWLQGIIVLAITVAMGIEWLQLVPVVRLPYRCLCLLMVLLCIWLAELWPYPWLLADMLLWGFIFVAVVTYPISARFWGGRVIVGASSLIILPTVVVSLVALHQQPFGNDLILYFLCLVWATDIGAYFSGKQWGQHKLIPNVSPGKTVEGALGGFLLAIIVSIVGFVYFHPLSAMKWFGLAVIIILISMLGDLFISMLKRRCHLKDTGQLLPGHGGVLDRMDSFIAALPFFYYGIL